MFAPGSGLVQALGGLDRRVGLLLDRGGVLLGRRDLRALLGDLDGRLHARVQVAVVRVGAGLGELDRHRLGLLAAAGPDSTCLAPVYENFLPKLDTAANAGLRLRASCPLNQNAAPAASADARDLLAGRDDQLQRPVTLLREVDGVEAGGDERHRVADVDLQLGREEGVRDGRLAELLGRGRGRSDVHRLWSWPAQRQARADAAALANAAARRETINGAPLRFVGPSQRDRASRCQVFKESVVGVRGSRYGYLSAPGAAQHSTFFAETPSPRWTAIEIVAARCAARCFPLLALLHRSPRRARVRSGDEPRAWSRRAGRPDLQRVVRDAASGRARRRHGDVAQRLAARAQRPRRRRQLRLPAAVDVRNVRPPLRRARAPTRTTAGCIRRCAATSPCTACC